MHEAKRLTLTYHSSMLKDENAKKPFVILAELLLYKKVTTSIRTVTLNPLKLLGIFLEEHLNLNPTLLISLTNSLG
jgi:hypothetical protein